MTFGTLRYCFSKIPIIPFFATVTPNVLGYIGELFYLHSLTCLHKQPFDHPNITYIVNSITKLGFQNLDFLIFKAGLILKIIVFVNKIEENIILTAHFKNLLPLKQYGQGDLLIQTFNFNYKTFTQLDFLKDFWTKET